MSLWLLSIAVAIYGVLRALDWQPPDFVTIKSWIKTHRAELIVIMLILAAAFVIRILDLELFPYSFNNDEGQMGSGADCILKGGCKNFFHLEWAAQPELAFLAYAISVGIFGKTAFAVRLVSAAIGTLAVLAVYLLGRETFGKKVGWLAAILLTTLPVHVHFSRMGVDNIIDSLTTPLMLWLLLRGVRCGSRLCFLAAGILAGLCFYTYPGSLLAPAFGVGALGWFALRTRGFLRAHTRNIVIFGLVAAIVVIPIMGFYSTHSNLFLARMKQEGIFQNGKLEKKMQETGENAAAVILRQFSASSFVYISIGAPLNFFNSPKAYLPPLEAILFMLGLAYIIWRIRDPRYLIIFIWFWTVVILGNTLTNTPPNSQRILMSLPAVVIMIALSLSKIEMIFIKMARSGFRFVPYLLLGVTLFIGYSNITYYFHDYRLGHYYEDPKDELTYETRIYTMPLGAQGRVCLIGDPRTPYTDFKSFDFFAPDVDMSRMNDVTYQRLLNLPYDKDMLFIALPGYEADLKFVAQMIPGGEWHEVKRRYQPQSVLFHSYKISREQLTVFTAFSQGYDTSRFGP